MENMKNTNMRNTLRAACFGAGAIVLWSLAGCGGGAREQAKTSEDVKANYDKMQEQRYKGKTPPGGAR